MSTTTPSKYLTPMSVTGPAGASPNVRGASGHRHHLNPNNFSGLNASAIPTSNVADLDSSNVVGNGMATNGGGALATYEQPGPLTATHASRSARASNVHAMLTNAERELALLREENAIRGAEIDTLKAQLQREHEQNLRQQSRHDSDLSEMREEYERQQGQLIEQITVLKGVSESALSEKKKSTEEAASRKQQLMSLLEKEREEKSTIMADYRTQTEALIAEQGREISGLRSLLEAAREEEEKYVAASKQQEERRQDLEEQLLKAETTLSDERVTAQRRLREVELRHTTQLEQVREKQDREETQLRQSLLKATTAREQLEDDVRSLSERIKQVESANDQERDQLKKAYEADVSQLQNELRVGKENRERMESKLKAEVERLTRGDEELITSLRKEIESLRLQKQSQFAEFNREKEASTTEHHSKMASLQAAIDGVRSELAEERGNRKTSEAALQSAQLKVEQQSANISRLQSELESTQIDNRSRERSMEQSHNDTVEALRNNIHSLEGETAQLKQTNKRLEVELQRAVDENGSKQSHIDQLKTEHRREVEMLKAQAEAASSQNKETNRQSQRSIDILQSQKVQLEADVNRLTRGLEEMESRASTAQKQLNDERNALEAAMADTQNFKTLVGEVKASLDAEKSKSSNALSMAAERETEINILRSAQEDSAENLREARRQADRLREEMNNVVAAHETANSELRAAQRQQVQQLETQLESAEEAQSHAKDAASALEDQLRVVRDEVTKWQRECIAKDEQHAEVIRNLRNQEEDELGRMDTIVASLRDDIARVQAQKTALQREVNDAQRDGDRRSGLIQEALDSERASKQRLHEELRNKEQFSAELQGTVRLLNARVAAKEDDVRRLEQENEELAAKTHDAHNVIGKKEAAIGQLMAKLRVYESRGSL